MDKQRISLNEVCLWLMAALYIILPTYFAFEISSFLPSFTASRIVLIFTLLITIQRSKKVMVPRSNEIRTIYVTSLIVITANLLHLSDGGSYSIKAIFSIVLENIILVYVVFNILTTKRTIQLFIKIMVVTSGVVTFFAIIEFLTSYNFFHLLNTTSRTVYQASYIRSGMTRAEASFGHSVYYGVYCSCMLPFSLYLYENSGKKKYAVLALLNIVGTLISGSRGQMVACFATAFIMFCQKKSTLKRKYIRAVIIGLIFASILAIFTPGVFSYVSENIKSILNILGFKFEIASDFGINAEGLDSRTIQLTGIRWLVLNNVFWFGLGSLAPARGLVSYYWSSYGWQTVRSIDVGYVGWFLEYGLWGAVGYSVLFIGFTKAMVKKSNEKDVTNLFNPFKWFMICYLLNLLSSTGMEKMLWIVLALIVCAERVEKQESRA